MDTLTQQVQQTLRDTTTRGLLRTAYSLTHHIHEADAKRADDLRAQRDLITAELVRRAGE